MFGAVSTIIQPRKGIPAAARFLPADALSARVHEVYRPFVRLEKLATTKPFMYCMC